VFVTYITWPMFDLRLSTPDLELRVVAEQDLASLSELLPDDMEQNPYATTFDVSAPQSRAVVLHQGYWKDMGTWQPDAWVLQFAVFQGGRLIGHQTLEANDFPTVRTVDSSSWLVPHMRGAGLGKQMRRAVLTLAFGPLVAQSAITSAWHDNHASLAVSRAVGYRPNGLSRHPRDNDSAEMVHLRLTREDWLASQAGEHAVIESFEPCRPFFGL
jgi:RimJ/RimL family protein N-acetyltransferase